jgi:hypothetical protein
MVKRYWVLLGAAPLVCGCDHFSGPYIVNGYGTDVDMTVAYSDGTSSTDRWPPCSAALIGNGKLQVTSVVVRKDGLVVREMDASAVAAMLEREKNLQDTRWVVSANGVTMVTGKEAGPCANVPRPDHPIPLGSVPSR